MPKTTIKAKTVDLGELELGDRLFVVLELEVMDEGRRRNGTSGTVDYRGAVVKEVLRLSGDLPVDLANELRRQAREAEEGETGIAVVPGLEGFLDAGGVVVTEADGIAPAPKPIGETELERDELDAVARWVSLGEEVHALRAAEGTDLEAAGPRLDALFAELNAVLTDDEVIDDDGELIIVDLAGEVRTALILPDFEPEVSELELDIEPEPWAGYDELDFDAIVEHVDGYLRADRELAGKPTAQALEYLHRAHVYERGHGGRARIVKALADRVTLIAKELEAEPAGEVAVGTGPVSIEAPWDGYDGSTADSVIGHLKAVAERQGDEVARPIVAATEAYETAHKARKGVLGRLAGIVPPPLPPGPDIGGTGDELEDALAGLDEDAVDNDVEP